MYFVTVQDLVRNDWSIRESRIGVGYLGGFRFDWQGIDVSAPHFCKGAKVLLGSTSKLPWKGVTELVVGLKLRSKMPAAWQK